MSASQQEVDRQWAHLYARDAERLERSGLYRVLRRLVPGPLRLPIPEGTKTKRGMFVDLESTGLDVLHDRIIEFCAVPFVYGLDGVIYEFGDHYVGRNDPKVALSEEIVLLTGITDDDVKDQTLDRDRILDMAAATDLFVAHNADFDRKFTERHFEASPFQDRPWACSQVDVPWRDLTGSRNNKLDYLLMIAAKAFHEQHGALADCYAALHLLTGLAPDGRSYFAYLLHSARTPKSRVWARGAPFEVKDALKRRNYRWNDGTDGRLKAWWKDIDDLVLDEEREWLRAEARCPAPLIIKVTAYDRYSVRA